MNEFTRALSQEMNYPDRWEIDRYRALHIPSNSSFWIANGWPFFDGDSDFGECKSIQIPFFSRPFLWFRFRRLLTLKKIEMLRAAK